MDTHESCEMELEKCLYGKFIIGKVSRPIFLLATHPFRFNPNHCRGEIYPVAGNVCMDMLMVDLGIEDDTHSIGSIVEVGDEAILWGPDESNEKDGLVRLCDIASTLKTTQSALTCGLNIERVDRKLVR